MKGGRREIISILRGWLAKPLPLTSNYSFPSFFSEDGYNYISDWTEDPDSLLRITSGYRHLSLIRTKSYQGPISWIKQTLACARRVIKTFCQILETFSRVDDSRFKSLNFRKIYFSRSLGFVP